MKPLHYILILAVFISFLGGFFLGNWAGTPYISQPEQNLLTDLSASPKQIDSQKKSSNIVDREKSARIRKSGAEKEQRLKVSTKDEISEATKKLPHEMLLSDSQTTALLELEKEAALEEFAQYLRTTGLSEEEIEEQLQTLKTPSEPEQSELPQGGDRSFEELEEELAISLLEAGVPDEDVKKMIQGMFHEALQPEPPPPFSAPDEDQATTGH